MSYSLSYSSRTPFSDLKGKTFVEVKRCGDDEIHFVTNSGRRFILAHRQDCCESVWIESIVGDLSDLVESKILRAEESTNDAKERPDGDAVYESATWTFYKLATAKGYVDIRFFGESNGYYSESADLYEVENEQTW